MKKRELIIKNEIEELAKIEPFTEEFASGTGILQETLFKLNLIMDEILCTSYHTAIMIPWNTP